MNENNRKHRKGPQHVNENLVNIFQINIEGVDYSVSSDGINSKLLGNKWCPCLTLFTKYF